MGKNDSTKTRVTPVFGELFNRDPTGATWLAALLSLPARDGAVAQRAATAPILAPTMGFGTDEVSLDPPLGLLRWMIENPTKLSRPKQADKQAEITKAKRNALLVSDPAVQAEALAGLANRAVPQAWYVLEGRSRPDVYFETSDAIVAIEGKRTELGVTSKTSWLPDRHQMLRHLDCAWERRNGKRLFGFFIVEGEDDDSTVPKKWRRACDETVASKILETSLPHRSPSEQAAIASSFLGATTWQAVCVRFGIKMPG